MKQSYLFDCLVKIGSNPSQILCSKKTCADICLGVDLNLAGACGSPRCGYHRRCHQPVAPRQIHRPLLRRRRRRRPHRLEKHVYFACCLSHTACDVASLTLRTLYNYFEVYVCLDLVSFTVPKKDKIKNKSRGVAEKIKALAHVKSQMATTPPRLQYYCSIRYFFFFLLAFACFLPFPADWPWP